MNIDYPFDNLFFHDLICFHRNWMIKKIKIPFLTLAFTGVLETKSDLCKNKLSFNANLAFERNYRKSNPSCHDVAAENI